MPTICVIYSAKDAKNADDYEKYLKQKKIPLLRSQPMIKSWNVYRIDAVLEPAGTQPPYQFVGIGEVSSIEEFAKANQTPEMRAFRQEYMAYLDPAKIIGGFTMGHKVEPGT